MMKLEVTCQCHRGLANLQSETGERLEDKKEVKHCRDLAQFQSLCSLFDGEQGIQIRNFRDCMRHCVGKLTLHRSAFGVLPPPIASMRFMFLSVSLSLHSWCIATRSAWIDFSSLKDYRNLFGILCCIGSSPSVYKQSLNYWLHKIKQDR
ncbi:hypothetical protein OUZ56_022173 [Daphnia magna]|uniref:Uncharacterized protein n=1 Tax=Daphnia magna TaxID=35525 RepID=A0ABR0AVK0_9CRUS|nr:hypothetical protein OUZ56_022173 [Daphnia magna]